MTCSNRLFMIIVIGWLPPFWSLPYLAAFVTLPTQQRNPSLFPGENHAKCRYVVVHLFGDTANDIVFKEEIEISKRDIEGIIAKAETEIAKLKTDLNNTEARSEYLIFLKTKFRGRNLVASEQAVIEAETIKRKAISDMDYLAYESVADFVKACNSTDRRALAETAMKEMERIKAEGLKQIEDISAKLDKDAKVAAEAFEILLAATR